MSRPTIGSPDWGDQLNADLNAIEALALNGSGTAIDHGSVSGAQTISAVVASLHEFTLTGDTVFTADGDPGATIAVRLYGTGSVTLDNVTWDSMEVELPGGFVLTHWAGAGWRATIIGGSTEIIETAAVTAPTFNDSTGVLTIPTVLGVQYKKNGVNISGGTHASQEGTANITASAKTGYVLPAGSTTSWPHTFPGWAIVAEDTFIGANGTLINGRTTSPNFLPWAADQGTIQDNAFYWDQHGLTANASVTVDATPQYTDNRDSRISGNYDMTGVPNGSVPTLGFVFQWAYTLVTPSSLKFFLERGDNFNATGPVTISCQRDNGTTPTLVPESGKALTNHPDVGKFTVETIGYTAKVYINDVLIAQANLGADETPNNKLGVLLSNRYPKLLDVKMESYGT